MMVDFKKGCILILCTWIIVKWISWWLWHVGLCWWTIWRRASGLVQVWSGHIGGRRYRSHSIRFHLKRHCPQIQDSWPQIPMQKGIWKFYFESILKFDCIKQNNFFFLICVYFNFKTMVNFNVLENKMTL